MRRRRQIIHGLARPNHDRHKDCQSINQSFKPHFRREAWRIPRKAERRNGHELSRDSKTSTPSLFGKTSAVLRGRLALTGPQTSGKIYVVEKCCSFLWLTILPTL